MLTISEAWKMAYPTAHVGILVMEGVTNPETCPALEQQKKELEEDLRSLFKVPADLKSVEPVKSYQNYYKRFNKTYHVLQQVQSVAFKGKSVPRVACLIEAMFMAELRNMLLTAGHDLDVVEQPIRLEVAQGGETFVRMNSEEQVLKQGDMYIADTQGIISSVIYGPDSRTRIRPSTTRALFTVYSVPGVTEQATVQHLKGIETYVRLVEPSAEVKLLKVY